MITSYAEYFNAVLGLAQSLGILDVLKFGILAIVTISVALKLLSLLK